MTDDKDLVSMDEMAAFLDRIEDSDAPLAGYHILGGMVAGRRIEHHSREEKHPAECCKYCAEDEIRQAGLAFGRNPTEENKHRLIEAVSKQEELYTYD